MKRRGNGQEKAGEAIGADWDFMVKKRLGPEEVEITPRELEVEGRDVVIIDDIISTGGTMSEAIQIIKDRGAGMSMLLVPTRFSLKMLPRKSRVLARKR